MLSDRCPVLSCLSSPVCLSVTLVYCDQTVERIKIKVRMQVGLGPGHTDVLHEDQFPNPKRGWGTGSSSNTMLMHSPPFSAHVRCSQTAGWIKMPLGMEVGRPSPIDFVLDGDPDPPLKKGAQRPIFGPCLFCSVL